MHHPANIAQKFIDISGDPVKAEMTPAKLLRLVYIAHGWMLGLYGKPLISGNVEAWQYGPVIPELYSHTCAFGRKVITKLPCASDIALTRQEEHLLNQVWDGYGKFDAINLSAMTHKKGTPWHILWRGQRTVISNEIIKSYYEGL